MEINSLKINQEISDIKEQLSGLLDLFYPVGSYYETSDISFFPEAVWGGTWRMDTKGYVTLGGLVDGGDNPREGGLDINLDETMGEVEHTLTVDEIPSHYHIFGYDIRQDATSFANSYSLAVCARWKCERCGSTNFFCWWF